MPSPERFVGDGDHHEGADRTASLMVIGRALSQEENYLGSHKISADALNICQKAKRVKGNLKD
jgi:hypothetical protein